MTFLGFWQLDRFHARHTINLRIDHANATAPVPIDTVIGSSLSAPDTSEWTRVTVTGTYDPAHTVVARDRSVDGVGFEILVPLVRADGSTILVDRGFLPATGDALQAPVVPPVPSGQVTVAGRIHMPESGADSPVAVGREMTVRRIDPHKIAPVIGADRLYADYLLLDQQVPAAAAGFERIPADRQPAWLNAGYTVQWWVFALLVLVGYGWAARREVRTQRDGGAGGAGSGGGGGGSGGGAGGAGGSGGVGGSGGGRTGEADGPGGAAGDGGGRPDGRAGERGRRPNAPRGPRSKDRLGEDAGALPLV